MNVIIGKLENEHPYEHPFPKERFPAEIMKDICIQFSSFEPDIIPATSTTL